MTFFGLSAHTRIFSGAMGLFCELSSSLSFRSFPREFFCGLSKRFSLQPELSFFFSAKACFFFRSASGFLFGSYPSLFLGPFARCLFGHPPACFFLSADASFHFHPGLRFSF